MKNRNSIEVRFERLAEEFAPPAPKPTPDDPLAQRRSSRIPRESLSAQSAVRKTYPLTRVWVSLCVDEDALQGQVFDEAYIRRMLAEQLAQELMSQMELRKDRDIAMWQTRYWSVLQIVDPKMKGQTLDMVELGDIP